MVTVRGLGLKCEVRRVLVGGIIAQGELDGGAVHAAVLAVGTIKPLEPGDATEELTLDSGWALGVAIGLVEEDGVARRALVGHLRRATS